MASLCEKVRKILFQIVKKHVKSFKIFIDWAYRDKFNNALLELQEQGVLAKMKNKWWNEVGAGICAVSVGLFTHDLLENFNPYETDEMLLTMRYIAHHFYTSYNNCGWGLVSSPKLNTLV